MTLKEINRYSFIGFIAVLAILILVWLRACTTNEPEAVKPIEKITRWKNTAGDSVASLKGSAEQFALRDKRIADSVAAVYKVKLKNMQEYIIAWTQSQADVPADPGTKETDYFPDTSKNCPPVVKNMRQQFNSAWDSITVQIGDSSYLHKISFDTLTAVWKKVKEGGLFNRKSYLQLDISFADTSRHITGLTAFRAPAEKQKRIGISLQAGYGFSKGLQPAPYIGLGISYTLIKF